jgi:hypothetical protein
MGVDLEKKMIEQKLLSRLQGVKKTGNNRWIALCPAHDDRSPSLGIGIGKNGGVLCLCRAKCPIDKVLDAVQLSLSELFPERLPDCKGQKPYLLKSEALSMVRREVMLVAMCGSRLLEGKLTDADRGRLFTAVGRIESVFSEAGISHGKY